MASFKLFFMVTAFCAIQLTPSSAQLYQNVFISPNDLVNRIVLDTVDKVIQLGAQFVKSLQDGISKGQALLEKVNAQNTLMLNSTQSTLQASLTNFINRIKISADVAEKSGRNSSNCLKGEVDNARRVVQQAGTDINLCINKYIPRATNINYGLSTLSDQVSKFLQDMPDTIIACIKLSAPTVFNCTYNSILTYNTQMALFAPSLSTKLEQITVQGVTLPIDLARCGTTTIYDRTKWFNDRFSVVQNCLDNTPVTNSAA